MKRSTLIFVFLSGVLAGSVAERLSLRFWRPRPPEPGQMIEVMSRDLGLDDAQRKKIEAIFREQEPKMRKFHRESRDKFEAFRKETDARINAVLRPDQREKFSERTARFERRGGPFFGGFGMGAEMPPPPPAQP